MLTKIIYIIIHIKTQKMYISIFIYSISRLAFNNLTWKNCTFTSAIIILVK